MKVTKTNLFYFSIIALNVAVAYAVSKFEGAISPLFISMVMGLIFVNAGGWSENGKEAATFAAKRCRFFSIFTPPTCVNKYKSHNH